MISTEDVKFIQGRFSRASERYERLAFIQNDIRRDLLARLDGLKGMRVLDVGCGTGALLSDLVAKDPGGHYVGVDLAHGMAEEARAADGGIGIVQADAVSLPFAAESFDLVVSSSSYQWVGDLLGAFSDVRRVVKQGGRFQAALFAQGTLCEFFESMQEARKVPSFVSRLPSEDEVGCELLRAGFHSVTVSCESRKTLFRDLWSLLVWLKSIGANNLGRGMFLGREVLLRAQEYYSRRYSKDGGIQVSFEVIWIDARK